MTDKRLEIQYLGINPFDVIKSRLNKSILFLVFYPTSRCNAFCRHCFNWRNVKNSKNRRELNLEEIKKITVNLGHVKYITLTGGEPFLRKDLYQIIRLFYVNNKTKRVVVHTNGSLPKETYKVIKKVLDACPKLHINLCVSIDALFGKHDRIRNVKGIFNKALKTISRIKGLEDTYKNLGLRSIGCLSKLNIKDIISIHNFMENKIGISYDIALLRGDVFKNEKIMIEPQEYAQVCKELNYHHRKKFLKNYPLLCNFRNTVESLKPDVIIRTLKKRREIFSCEAGKRAIVIMDDGDVYPCELFNKVERLGNVKETDYNLYELLNSEKAKGIINKIRDKKCWCTWECIIPLNLIFNLEAYPLIIRKNLQIIAAKVYYNSKIKRLFDIITNSKKIWGGGRFT